jgi:hypothetical protein
MFVLLFPAFLAYYLAVEHPFMSNRWWKRGGVPVPAAR